VTFTAAELDALEKPAPRVKVGKAYKGMPLERTIQRDIMRALGKLGYLSAHIANEGRLEGDATARMKQAAVRKADGLMRGIPDLIVFGRGGRVGLIEVKRPGSYLSAAQVACMAMIERLGTPCAAVCSVEDAVRAVKEWGWQ
jgi:hypothetical protein